jgi:hypothetical protein
MINALSLIGHPPIQQTRIYRSSQEARHWTPFIGISPNSGVPFIFGIPRRWAQECLEKYALYVYYAS